MNLFPPPRLRTLRAFVAKYGIFLYFEIMIKHTKIVLPLLVAALLVCGCDRPSGGYKESHLASSYDKRNPLATQYASSSSAGYSQQVAELLAYDDSAPFVSMSNLIGNESPAETADGDRLTRAREPAALPNTSRKLVKSANISIRVDDIDATEAAINDLMERHDAYASSTRTDGNSRNYTIRVPSPTYDVFLVDLDGMGRVLYRFENTEDVTLRYYDLEGRLASKEELLATYRSYLARARNMEEILAVEARISDLHNEIEGTGKELRQLANLIDYSTVRLDIRGPTTSEPYRGPTLGERVGELFMGFGEFLSGAAVVLIGLVIYGIPVLAVVVVLFWLLFGKVGLLKKLFRIAAGKKQGKESAGGPAP